MNENSIIDHTTLFSPVSGLGDVVKPLVLAFYKSQEDLAVDREDYEQAALWRDAPLSETPIKIQPEEDHFKIIKDNTKI